MARGRGGAARRLGRALSDPIRVRMLGMMAEGRGCCDFSGSGVPGDEDICVCEFEEYFGMGQSKVSYHMRKLKDAGLVREERRGKWSFYSLDREAAGKLLGEAADRPLSSPEKRTVGGDCCRGGGRSRVLFVCTHNSARSQMAEGLLRALAGDRLKALSADTEATVVRPLVVRAMDEIGIDILGQESKTLEWYLGLFASSPEHRRRFLGRFWR